MRATCLSCGEIKEMSPEKPWLCRDCEEKEKKAI